MHPNGRHNRHILKWLTITYFLCACIWTTTEVAAQNFTRGNSNGEVRKNRGSAYTIDINIFNRYDDHLIDTTYMGNSTVFMMLDSIMRDTAIINHTETINVISSSSIEGSLSYNTALSRRRMHSIEAALRSRYNFIEDEAWEFEYIPENWEHLRQAVVEDEKIPHKEELLSIIGMEHRDPDAREYLLKILDGGNPWSYICQHILPSSRGSATLLFVPEVAYPIVVAQPMTTQHFEEVRQEELPPLLYSYTPQSTQSYSTPIVAIRSNLLLDITSTINLAIEVPLSPRWSLAVEYIDPWWYSWDSELTWQIESLYFDLRYWLTPRSGRNTLTGWSVGLYGGSGRYDLQPFSDKGVQGEYSDFGATLSYAHTLGQSKHWLMEYTVGLGYLTTYYCHYYTASQTEEYGNIKVLNYPWSEETLGAPLPTRVGVTLVYLINVNRQKKRGGEL